jgi:hypothetical protein
MHSTLIQFRIQLQDEEICSPKKAVKVYKAFDLELGILFVLPTLMSSIACSSHSRPSFSHYYYFHSFILLLLLYYLLIDLSFSTYWYSSFPVSLLYSMYLNNSIFGFSLLENKTRFGPRRLRPSPPVMFLVVEPCGPASMRVQLAETTFPQPHSFDRF